MEARTTRWGFVRFWAKDQAIGNKIINARSETLADRPPFKDLLSSRRYLVPADGFYEWRKEGKTKQPIHYGLVTLIQLQKMVLPITLHVVFTLG